MTLVSRGKLPQISIIISIMISGSTISDSNIIDNENNLKEFASANERHLDSSALGR